MSTEKLTIRNATKLWQLLQLAIDDAKEIQKDPVYELEMTVWHTRSLARPAVCRVCLAGAVMVRELGALPHQQLDPTSFGDDESITNKLNAINDLRNGLVHLAYNTMSNGGVLLAFPRNVRLASVDAHRWADEPWTDDWKAHLALVAALKEADL